MWKAVNCEVQGRGHVKTNTPCQDKTLAVVLNGVKVIALADGAGSASLSHFGAEKVINCIVEYLSDNVLNLIANGDGKQVKQQIIEVVRKSLEEFTLENGCKINDLASTLLAVAVFEDTYVIVHIGDGVIGYLEGENLKVASAPDNGEFANVTTFVTSDEALDSMRIFKGKVNDIAGFVIMSDGTEQSLYHKTTNSLAKATIKLMHRTCLLSAEVMKEQLLTTLNSVIAANTQDDCSIALLVRPVGILCKYSELEDFEKCDVLAINSQAATTKKRLVWFDETLNFLKSPHCLKSIARYMRLKKKFTRKRLQKLLASGLVIRSGTLYVRTDIDA